MIKRIYVQKKSDFDVKSGKLLAELRSVLGLPIDAIKVVHVYDVDGISDACFDAAVPSIFSEPPIDDYWLEQYALPNDCRSFMVQPLPGQYDNCADFAMQSLMLIDTQAKPVVLCSTLYIVKGELSDEQFAAVKGYIINPIECHEVSADKPDTLEVAHKTPADVAHIDSFCDSEPQSLLNEYGLAMDTADVQFVQQYFSCEGRQPTVTELKMIDTYWSDHCRHTTFLTELNDIKIDDGNIQAAFDAFVADRRAIGRDKPITLMEIATGAMRVLKAAGKLQKLDESEEVNACSIKVDLDITEDGVTKAVPYLIQFKNETHNHPTEIEPYGGAATCLGGAIRDPLSGRAYVYQAMRITGAGDPSSPTIAGKLPQRKITTTAASGFSSYGNEIGIATGYVDEIYHSGYIAKRMEIGACIGAVPAEDCVRETPNAGDIIVLVGGRTGRDGLGGATGSSKAHTHSSIETCASEVQKGNPPEERKLQRLFLHSDCSRMIKRCNDFGAGGVAVAIGELADGIYVNLDTIPTKYKGLDATELTLSESQERMAVVIASDSLDSFMKFVYAENLEATVVGKVTDTNRVIFTKGNIEVVNIKRSFLNSNGASKSIAPHVVKPDYDKLQQFFGGSDKGVCEIVGDLNVCSKRGLCTMFDSSIGAATALLPYGGKLQRTKSQAMAAYVPTKCGTTETVTIMSHGYDPYLAEISPFHGSVYAILHSVAKQIATGAALSDMYLTLQEYFERLGDNPQKWGKPLASILGAYLVQTKLGIAAIGGKDSMSGSFNDIHVPPTLVSFAMSTAKGGGIISNELKAAGHKLVLVDIARTADGLPDFDDVISKYNKITALITEGKVASAFAVGEGGIIAALATAALGNGVGANLTYGGNPTAPLYGAILLEATADLPIGSIIGVTTDGGKVLGENIDDIYNAWHKPLADVFPIAAEIPSTPPRTYTFDGAPTLTKATSKCKPRVFIPVFPGTNNELDDERAFQKAGATPDTFVFNNTTPSAITQSIEEMARRISLAQMIMLPGGFSAGDQPEGSAKFIAAIFRNAAITEAVHDMLYNRDGLMLGICNGFQALVKLGLLPYGRIGAYTESSPTLTFNTIGRFLSTIVRTRVASTISPWLSHAKVGDVQHVPIAHGEGRFIANEQELAKLAQNGQIATQYVDLSGNVTYTPEHCPNGAIDAIESITSADGRIYGKMGHSERINRRLFKNYITEDMLLDEKIFESGTAYFL